MLAFLREALFEHIVPLMERLPECELDRANELVREINDEFDMAKNGFDVPAWYNKNNYVKDMVESFIYSKDVMAVNFGEQVEWLLTKGAYFYSDD